MGGLVPASAVPTAAASVVVAFGVAVVYFYVAYRFFARPISAESRLASAQFALWWGGLGASVVLQALALILAIAGVLPFALALTLALVLVAVDCALLWGLVGFLTYVYTGRYHLFGLTLFYIGFYVLVLYYELASAPNGVVLQNGTVTITTAAAPSLAVAVVVLIGLLGPEVAGAALYLS
ncbi:MAG: hypothetical protein ACREEC_04070, partial [Thermoplasmata archaeon]